MSITITKNTWKKAQYGLFYKYGLYSILDGVWEDTHLKPKDNDKILQKSNINFIQYEILFNKFKCEHFSAKELVNQAKAAKANYIIFSVKSYDGFCLWNTKTTYYNCNVSEAKRDLLSELSKECEKQGMNLGIYYSLVDWHSIFSLPMEKYFCEELPDDFFNYCIRQLRELLTNYGKFFSIYLDMGSPTIEQSQDLRRVIKRYQRDIMINSRIFNNQGDYVTITDKKDLEKNFNVLWEYHENIDEFENASDFIHNSFTKTISHGGNYLLEVPLDKDGTIRNNYIKFLNESAKCIEKYDFIKQYSQCFKIHSWGSIFGGSKYYTILINPNQKTSINFVVTSPPCRLINLNTDKKIKYTYKNNVLCFDIDDIDSPQIISLGTKKTCNLQYNLYRLKNKIHRLLLDEGYFQYYGSNIKKGSLIVTEYKIQVQPIKAANYKIELERTHAICYDAYVYFNNKKIYFPIDTLRITLSESKYISGAKTFSISSSRGASEPYEITCKNLHIIFTRLD